MASARPVALASLWEHAGRRCRACPSRASEKRFGPRIGTYNALQMEGPRRKPARLVFLLVASALLGWTIAAQLITADERWVAVAASKKAKKSKKAKRRKQQAAKKSIRVVKREQPNLIVIMTDDQAMNSWSREVMPNTFRRLVDRGTEFTDAIATPPLCCPARASFLTGEYPHNNGVWHNHYPWLRHKRDVLPVWLRKAGYRTAMIGKFLNAYAKTQGTGGGFRAAPGWQKWFSIAPTKPNYYNYVVSDNGTRREFGDDEEDYLTRVLNREAVSYIRASSKRNKPFFLWLAHFAPHFSPRDAGKQCYPGPIPLPDDYMRFAGSKVAFPPSFNERDVSDKKGPARNLPLLGERAQQRIAEHVRCAKAALQEVDRGVEEIFQALEETGQLEDTAVFFVSDNGFYFGEHRFPREKSWPYEAAARVPLAAWIPAGVLGTQQESTVDKQVGIIDLAPTLLQLAGVRGVKRPDGRSLLPLLRGREGNWPANRPLLLELGGKCGYSAVRTHRYTYIRWKIMRRGKCRLGPRELFDRKADPYQLHNLLADRKGRELARVSKQQAKRKRDDFEQLRRRLARCDGAKPLGRTGKPRKLPLCP